MTSHMRTSFIVLCVTFYWIPSQSPRVDQQQRISAFMKGDFIIGALFSIHHQPKQKRAGNTLVCGEVREMYGIQRVEVTFQTLDLINNDPYILPNITLGVEIRDSCWYAPVALQQSIEFIRDAISPATDPFCGVPKTTASSTSNPLLETFQPRSAPLVGVVGPGSSSVALQVQNLLQLFHIPQIGYSTTSKDLSDKSRFNYFLRVVPSDYYQAQVMVDIVRKYNWTYVSAVNTDENYGQSGIQAFRELAERASICIAKEDSVLSNAEDEVFDSVLLKLDQDKNARVVVCFCEGMTVRGLLAATQRLNLTGRFLFLGSDGWADRSDVADGYEEAAHGSLSIRIHSPYVRDFDEYYFKLNPFNNSRNPWFKEFWQSRFNCTLPGGGINDTQKRNCTGLERLNERYKQDPKLSFVIKAIFTLAHGLNHLRQDVCGRGTVGLCPELFPINGALFKSYLLNVSFTLHDGETVEFDRRGDPPGRYNIMNFQQLSNGSYDYINVGDWNNGTLNVWRDMQLGRKHGPVVESVCSRPCPPGYYKNLQSGGQEQKCCWVCVPCDRNQVLTDDETCSPCPLGWWPSLNKTMCIQIPIEFVKWTDTEALVSIGFSCMGFTVTAIAAAVFIRSNDTPVVKSSTRELSYMILAGMTLSHSATFPILARPSKLSCSLSRTIPGLSFAMIYASLLTKTNRIARILAGSKKRFPTRKPRFMSGTAQVVITCILIGVEAGVAGAMLVLEPAGPTLQFPTIDRAVLVCNTSPQGVVAPLAFDFFLIALCTLYALKTRNVPENFNEAKFIGFAMYTTCVIWIAFVPIYFGSDSKIITTCICITLSAMVTLVFLFLPKLYIILLRPERNNRSFFTTSKEIRCHIGTRVASAISSKSNAYLNSYSSNTESPRTNRTGTSALGDIKPSWQSTEDKLQLSHTDSQNSNIRNERCLTLYRNNVSKQENRLNCNNNVPRHRSISQSRDNDGSWKESQSVAWQPSSVKQEQCREQRSLSIQTGAELLEMLLEGRSLKWAELNPHDLLEATQRPSRSRPHIREESISGDDESGQLKNITIQLGGSSPSITSEYSDYFL